MSWFTKLITTLTSLTATLSPSFAQNQPLGNFAQTVAVNCPFDETCLPHSNNFYKPCEDQPSDEWFFTYDDEVEPDETSFGWKCAAVVHYQLQLIAGTHYLIKTAQPEAAAYAVPYVFNKSKTIVHSVLNFPIAHPNVSWAMVLYLMAIRSQDNKALDPLSHAVFLLLSDIQSNTQIVEKPTIATSPWIVWWMTGYAYDEPPKRYLAMLFVTFMATPFLQALSKVIHRFGRRTLTNNHIATHADIDSIGNVLEGVRLLLQPSLPLKVVNVCLNPNIQTVAQQFFEKKSMDQRILFQANQILKYLGSQLTWQETSDFIKKLLTQILHNTQDTILCSLKEKIHEPIYLQILRILVQAPSNNVQALIQLLLLKKQQEATTWNAQTHFEMLSQMMPHVFAPLKSIAQHQDDRGAVWNEGIPALTGIVISSIQGEAGIANILERQSQATGFWQLLHRLLITGNIGHLNNIFHTSITLPTLTLSPKNRAQAQTENALAQKLFLEALTLLEPIARQTTYQNFRIQVAPLWRIILMSLYQEQTLNVLNTIQTNGGFWRLIHNIYLQPNAIDKLNVVVTHALHLRQIQLQETQIVAENKQLLAMMPHVINLLGQLAHHHKDRTDVFQRQMASIWRIVLSGLNPASNTIAILQNTDDNPELMAAIQAILEHAQEDQLLYIIEPALNLRLIASQEQEHLIAENKQLLAMMPHVIQLLRTLAQKTSSTDWQTYLPHVFKIILSGVNPASDLIKTLDEANKQPDFWKLLNVLIRQGNKSDICAILQHALSLQQLTLQDPARQKAAQNNTIIIAMVEHALDLIKPLTQQSAFKRDWYNGGPYILSIALADLDRNQHVLATLKTSIQQECFWHWLQALLHNEAITHLIDDCFHLYLTALPYDRQNIVEQTRLLQTLAKAFLPILRHWAEQSTLKTVLSQALGACQTKEDAFTWFKVHSGDATVHTLIDSALRHQTCDLLLAQGLKGVQHRASKSKAKNAWQQLTLPTRVLCLKWGLRLAQITLHQSKPIPYEQNHLWSDVLYFVKKIASAPDTSAPLIVSWFSALRFIGDVCHKESQDSPIQQSPSSILQALKYRYGLGLLLTFALPMNAWHALLKRDSLPNRSTIVGLGIRSLVLLGLFITLCLVCIPSQYLWLYATYELLASSLLVMQVYLRVNTNHSRWLTPFSWIPVVHIDRLVFFPIEMGIQIINVCMQLSLTDYIKRHTYFVRHASCTEFKSGLMHSALNIIKNLFNLVLYAFDSLLFILWGAVVTPIMHLIKMPFQIIFFPTHFASLNAYKANDFDSQDENITTSNAATRAPNRVGEIIQFFAP